MLRGYKDELTVDRIAEAAFVEIVGIRPSEYKLRR